ncbi:MAG: YbaK/EbsC family protein [archaeon]
MPDPEADLALFIEANALKARIVSFNAEISFHSAVKSAKLSQAAPMQCQLYRVSKIESVLVIVPFDAVIDKVKLTELVGAKSILEADDEDTYKRTGYNKAFLPPISLYGLKVIIDKSVPESTLAFQVDEKDFLVIELSEILSSNEEVVFGEIIVKSEE